MRNEIPGWNLYPMGTDFTPLTLAAFVFPVKFVPLMIPITLRTYNCLYFPAWAEGLKDFPKTLLQKQILSLHFPLQEEGKGQRTSYQRGLVNIWFTKRNLLRVVEVGIFFSERSHLWAWLWEQIRNNCQMILVPLSLCRFNFFPHQPEAVWLHVSRWGTSPDGTNK